MDFAILIAAGLYMVVLGVAAVRTERYRDRFPPISVDEFMARCPPGTDRRVALKVRRIVSEQTGLAYDRIAPSTRFGDDLGIG